MLLLFSLASLSLSLSNSDYLSLLYSHCFTCLLCVSFPVCLVWFGGILLRHYASSCHVTEKLPFPFIFLFLPPSRIWCRNLQSITSIQFGWLVIVFYTHRPACKKKIIIALHGQCTDCLVKVSSYHRYVLDKGVKLKKEASRKRVRVTPRRMANIKKMRRFLHFCGMIKEKLNLHNSG